MATVKCNTEKNGIEIYFPKRPAGSVIEDLKGNGFRWSRFNSCWYKKDSQRTREIAARYGKIQEGSVKDNREAESIASYVQAQEEAMYEGKAGQVWGSYGH